MIFRKLDTEPGPKARIRSSPIPSKQKRDHAPADRGRSKAGPKTGSDLGSERLDREGHGGERQTGDQRQGRQAGGDGVEDAEQSGGGHDRPLERIWDRADMALLP